MATAEDLKAARIDAAHAHVNRMREQARMARSERVESINASIYAGPNEVFSRTLARDADQAVYYDTLYCRLTYAVNLRAHGHLPPKSTYYVRLDEDALELEQIKRERARGAEVPIRRQRIAAIKRARDILYEAVLMIDAAELAAERAEPPEPGDGER